jgi:hypothetical protein
MPWVEIFAVFIVSHLVGDFAMQTEWQARHKFGGLGTDPKARRALVVHVGTYVLAFIPAFVWLGYEVGALVAAIAAILVVSHLVVDDGRLVHRYMHRVKHTDPVGLASHDELVEAYRHALETDPVASFGGIVGDALSNVVRSFLAPEESLDRRREQAHGAGRDQSSSQSTEIADGVPGRHVHPDPVRPRALR